MTTTFDIRHNGKFLARSSDEIESVARMHAERLVEAHAHLGGGLTIEESKPYELHCRKGYIDAFDTRDEAEAMAKQMADRHAAHVARGGPKALVRTRKRRGVKAPLGFLHSADSPEFEVRLKEGFVEPPPPPPEAPPAAEEEPILIEEAAPEAPPAPEGEPPVTDDPPSEEASNPPPHAVETLPAPSPE